MIKIRELKKDFKEIKAVDGISLDVEKGELFGLLGPNGAGKTTLISMIAGLIHPGGGTIHIDGLDIEKDAMEVRRLTGLVPQEMAFYTRLSAKDNIEFFGKLYGLKGTDLKEAIDRALEFSGLTEAGKKRADQFSGGMKRRLNIACGIVHSPELVFMDEPTVGIDPQSRNHILRSVEQLNRSGCTIIYTTHYMEEAENLCSRIAIIDKGKIIAEGSRDDLRRLVSDSVTIEIVSKGLGEVNSVPLKQISGVEEVISGNNRISIKCESHSVDINTIVAELTRQNIAVADLRVEVPDLETVFLSLTGRTLRD